jgi:hypothetical protein
MFSKILMFVLRISKYGSSGKTPVLQVQNPELKPQYYHSPAKKKKKKNISTYPS